MCYRSQRNALNQMQIDQYYTVICNMSLLNVIKQLASKTSLLVLVRILYFIYKPNWIAAAIKIVYFKRTKKGDLARLIIKQIPAGHWWILCVPFCTLTTSVLFKY